MDEDEDLSGRAARATSPPITESASVRLAKKSTVRASICSSLLRADHPGVSRKNGRHALRARQSGWYFRVGNRGKRRRPGFRRADRQNCSLMPLGEVVADVAEDVLELAAQEDHGDDDRDGNDGNDECVLHKALAFVVTEECEHRF